MTGMRRNEVLGLKWIDIDFKKQTIRLAASAAFASWARAASDHPHAAGISTMIADELATVFRGDGGRCVCAQ